MTPRTGIFVTGTDTGVGKTVVSAALVWRWHASYWKPVQTGLAQDDADTETVAQLSGAATDRLHPPRYGFAAPLSPEAAGAREGIVPVLADLGLPAGDGTLVVEGAGGVLVPLGAGASMADLMRRLGLPVLLVARSTLGTINHTLLSLEALRAREILVWGVVLVGPEPDENAATIARLGEVAILGMLPKLDPLTPRTLAEAAAALPAEPPGLTVRPVRRSVM